MSHTQRHISIKFRAEDVRTYTYIWTGAAPAVGDLVEIEMRGRPRRVIVVDADAPQPNADFEIKRAHPAGTFPELAPLTTEQSAP
jgi:hypothetical protein